MFRAFSISVLAHVLAIVSLFEFRPLPAYPTSAANGRPLTVDIAHFKIPEDVARDRRRNASAASVVGERHFGRRTLPASSGGRRPAGVQMQAVRQVERPQSSSLAALEVMPGLPAELESEYRLNIARELRRAGAMSQTPGVFRRQGSVRLVISYWTGLHSPVVSLDRSSGYPELDEMAQASLMTAVARARLPEVAGRGGFSMPFVVEYRQAQ